MAYLSNGEITEIMQRIMVDVSEVQKFLFPKTMGQETHRFEEYIGIGRKKMRLPKAYCRYM